MALTSRGHLELSVDSYATFSQVRAYIPGVRSFDNSSHPTIQNALSITRDIYQEINGLLYGLGYVLPVASSNTTGIRIVGRLNALGAAAAIEAAAYSAGNEEESQQSVRLTQQYRDAWDRLESGSVIIIGATMQSNYIHRRNERKATAFFDQDSSSTERSPTFTKSMKW